MSHGDRAPLSKVLQEWGERGGHPDSSSSSDTVKPA